MKTLNVLTEEDVHKIAYLTMKGWEFLCGEWRKPQPGDEKSLEWKSTEVAYWDERADSDG